MRTQPLGATDLAVPVIAAGCMRLSPLDADAAARFVGSALDEGLNFFDHADIYGRGESEVRFAEAMARLKTPRDRVILQSKCGIIPGARYDCSREHILASVDGILGRLRTDHLDVLLLHRPDALMEPDEVAAAFDDLAAAGKVRHFGVSNQDAGTMALLRASLGNRPLVANQLQLSVAHASAITAALNVNLANDAAVDRDGGALDYCRRHRITVQPWSPFQFGFFGGTFIGHADWAPLNAKLDEIGARHGATATTAALAWLLRHPARMQPVVGTMKAARLRECARAADVALTRAEWYEILLAAGNKLP